MEIGMLWFDNDPKRDFVEKVQKAASYYQQKYQKEPNLCFVHPSMVAKSGCKTNSIVICPSFTIQQNHFWIGFANEDEISAYLTIEKAS